MHPSEADATLKFDRESDETFRTIMLNMLHDSDHIEVEQVGTTSEYKIRNKIND